MLLSIENVTMTVALLTTEYTIKVSHCCSLKVFVSIMLLFSENNSYIRASCSPLKLEMTVTLLSTEESNCHITLLSTEDSSYIG